ncbi:FHA domain-containing protein [Nocardioides sp.]|uniref:FHA domain-containing protein n=1 Tax=Nocardioides sp. TaxID=35761 RepID=UPI00286AD112|nr:FHA domain-containing protein [Nocardioides sp.]
MSALRVVVDGRTILVDPPRLLRIGRAVESDVLLAGDSVSRVHAELRPTRAGWVLVDVASAHGTFVDGERVTELRLTRETQVRCGPEGTGSVFTVTPEVASGDGVVPVQQERPTAVRAPGQTPPDAGFENTMVVAPAVRPGPAPGGPAARSGPALLVSAEGREHRFSHPTGVTIGRLPDCAVVLTDPVCSRLHGRVDAVPEGWIYTNASREGTFVGGRRVDRLVVKERVALRLGHPVAGPEVSLVPILSAQEEERRLARARWARRLAVIGGGAAVLLVIVASGVTAAVLLDRSDPARVVRSSTSSSTPGLLTGEELDSAKVATVLISAESTDSDGNTVSWSGSGSIISPDGMILTNAHVAEPQADGLAQQYGPTDEANPDYLEIALIGDADDAAAAPAFRARVVVSDGFMDASVIQIYATIDGGPLEGELDLPTIAIGSSADLSTGEDVTVLGFPGISGSARVSVTRGVISTFLDDDRLGPRSEIDTDARIAPGNSGGAAIDNEAEIVGIPSATFSQQGSSVVSGRIRSIDVVKPLIAEAEAQTSGSQD